MSYITLQGLIDRYGDTELMQLTDALGTGVLDAAAINRAIADADAEIDAYLAGRMVLPLSPVPLALERIAAVMVRYYLYKDAAPDLVAEQYKAAVKFLAEVSAGRAQLGPAETGGATPETAAPSWSSADPVFSAESMRGF